LCAIRGIEFSDFVKILNNLLPTGSHSVRYRRVLIILIITSNDTSYLP